jgi:integrase
MIGLAEALRLVKQQQHNHDSIRAFIAGNYPDTLRALKTIDMEAVQARRRKGFNLVKRENKKYGFLYYVRYWHSPILKMLPNAWNTHTNDIKKAEKFARENKNRLIERYLQKHDTQMYSTLESFFDGKPENSHLSERCRTEYRAAIANRFIPFLKSENIASLGQITAKTLVNYQDCLMARGIRPQTANNYLKPVRQIFAYLFRRGAIDENPADWVRGIPVRKKDKKKRGCYEVDKLKGVFNRRWKEPLPYLLSLLIYTTGMRDIEIKRMRKEDIALINGCRFIRVKQSKTENGIRLAPCMILRTKNWRHGQQKSVLNN